jgi:hypothetical protein
LTPLRAGRDNRGSAGTEKTLEPRLRQLLEELSEKLGEAIAECPEVGEKLDEVRSAGYSVYLLLDCKRRVQRGRRALPSGRREGADEASTSSPPVEPGVFRINAGDLSFLRSLGIDPTRQLRRRAPRPLLDDAGGED